MELQGFRLESCRDLVFIETHGTAASQGLLAFPVGPDLVTAALGPDSPEPFFLGQHAGDSFLARDLLAAFRSRFPAGTTFPLDLPDLPALDGSDPDNPMAPELDFVDQVLQVFDQGMEVSHPSYVQGLRPEWLPRLPWSGLQGRNLLPACRQNPRPVRNPRSSGHVRAGPAYRLRGS